MDNETFHNFPYFVKIFLLVYYYKQNTCFLNASKYCGSVFKNDFVVVVLVVVIFKESDYFKSLVETCPKRKTVVGAG